MKVAIPIPVIWKVSIPIPIPVTLKSFNSNSGIGVGIAATIPIPTGIGPNPGHIVSHQREHNNTCIPGLGPIPELELKLFKVTGIGIATFKSCRNW